MVLVRDLLHLGTYEIIPGVADAAVGVPVVARVLGANSADTVDLDVESLAETNVFEQVFVLATGGDVNFSA